MGLSDQEAMVQKMLQKPFSDWVKVVPGKLFNCYDYDLYGIGSWAHKYEVNAYQAGDWILHCAGLTGDDRMNVLRRYDKLRT
jgi:hypothetical protein